MLNNLCNKNYKKTIHRIALSSLLLISTSWCLGGGGWSDGGDNSSSGSSWDTNSGSSGWTDIINTNSNIIVTVQLNESLSNSEVILKTLDWNYIIEAITNQNWEFVLDSNELKEALASNGLTYESDILVEASYWFDSQIGTGIDWTIRNIIKSKNLHGSYVTYYSDCVTNILLWVDNNNLSLYIDNNWNINLTLINAELNGIINELKIEDVNYDGILNRDDINYHNVVTNTSNLYANIPWYRQAIIYWDRVEKQAIIDELELDFDEINIMNQIDLLEFRG